MSSCETTDTMSELVRPTDVDLMLRVRESDSAAFGELLGRHRRPLTGFFTKLCRDADFAEDLFQETFIRVWQARERYEPSGRLAGYLYTIARNVWLHEKERRGHRPSESEPDPDRPSALELAQADERQLPEAVLEAREWQRQLDESLDRLDDKLQQVFVLSHFAGLKYAAISEQLHVPVGTVKYRMFQAVRELREMMEEA